MKRDKKKKLDIKKDDVKEEDDISDKESSMEIQNEMKEEEDEEVDEDSSSNDEQTKKKKKKSNGKKRGKYTRRACTNCKSAHAACDAGRPCKRCIMLGKEDSCVDSVRKKRKPAVENIYTETYEPLTQFIGLLKKLPDYVPTPDPYADQTYDDRAEQEKSDTDNKKKKKKKKKIKAEAKIKEEMHSNSPATPLALGNEEEYFKNEFVSEGDQSYLDILQERISSPNYYVDENQEDAFKKKQRRRKRFEKEYKMEGEEQLDLLMSTYQNNQTKIDSLSHEVNQLEEQLGNFKNGSDELAMNDEADLLKLL